MTQDTIKARHGKKKIGVIDRPVNCYLRETDYDRPVAITKYLRVHPCEISAIKVISIEEMRGLTS